MFTISRQKLPYGEGYAILEEPEIICDDCGDEAEYVLTDDGEQSDLCATCLNARMNDKWRFLDPTEKCDALSYYYACIFDDDSMKCESI